jgi:hypothetical protein
VPVFGLTTLRLRHVSAVDLGDTEAVLQHERLVSRPAARGGAPSPICQPHHQQRGDTTTKSDERVHKPTQTHQSLDELRERLAMGSGAGGLCWQCTGCYGSSSINAILINTLFISSVW